MRNYFPTHPGFVPIGDLEHSEVTGIVEAPPGAGGVKHDGGKDPWDLLPWDAVRCIVWILSFGAVKYAPRNWEKGMKWSRVFAALMRHLTSWWEGESKDPETGKSHLWHAGCCVLFLITYELRGVGEDDRPRKE